MGTGARMCQGQCGARGGDECLNTQSQFGARGGGCLNTQSQHGAGEGECLNTLSQCGVWGGGV